MREIRKKNVGIREFAIYLFLIFFSCGRLPAVEISSAAKTNGQSERYRAFLLRNITAEAGKQFLSSANITGATALNGSNTLQVTARPDVLIKAAALLAAVDSTEKYEVKELLPASEANSMPPVAVIQAEIGKTEKPISIGTFFNPPGSTARKVIIDVHEDKLYAIAPASVMEKLVAITRHGAAEGEARAKSAAGKSDKTPKADEPDKAFGELLDSIAQAQNGLQKPAAETDLPQSTPRPQREEVEKTTSASTESQNPPDESQEAEANTPEPNRNPYQPEVVPNGDETLDLVLPEKLEIIPFLDLVGKYLNLNYVYDPQQLLNKPQVHLKVQGPVKVNELYPLAESVLKFAKLAMTRKGNLVTIVSEENALDVDPILIDADKGQVLAGDVVVTRIFQLHYVDTAQARVILDGMKVGAITEMPGTGTLIITGYAYRMTRVEQLLEIIDKPGKPRQFKFRQLRYTMASTLAPKIKLLVEQLGEMSITIASPQAASPMPIRRAPVRTPMQPQPAQMGGTGAAKPAIYLDADERTNRIFMIGNEQELEIVDNLIDSLDVAQQDIRSIRVYEIQHVGAEEVRKKLEELGVVGASRETAAPGRITARAAARAAAAQGQPGMPPSPVPMSSSGEEPALPTEEVQVIIIESTNALMVNASPEQHAMIASIIAYVDSETIQQAIPYVVYPLENQNPEVLAEVLNKLIQETVLDKEGKIQEVVQRQEEQIVIVPDESTFSLIVFASKKNQDWISNLVKSLDKRRPQVLIDVTLVEVTKTDTFEYDLDLVTKFPVMKSGEQMEFLGHSLLGGGDGSVFPDKTVIEATSIGGEGRGFYADRHIQALLRLIQQKNYGRILAKPKILVNDNESGKIVAQDTTYVIKQTSVPITPVTGSVDVPTFQTAIDYAGYDAGITLDIKPHISEGDLLRLEIAMTRSDFVGDITGDVPPDTKTSDISTVVTVPNGSTIILGGLIKLNQSKRTDKVPLLGDIPLVGGLFRSTSNSVNDSKLYIFVKANILRPEMTQAGAGLPELVNISDKNRAAFEKHEDEFQKHQSWPGVKPKPVAPVRVLDAE